jgi:hypothetical protein
MIDMLTHSAFGMAVRGIRILSKPVPQAKVPRYQEAMFKSALPTAAAARASIV